jgi:DNA-binding MarR family transcriptional regulator
MAISPNRVHLADTGNYRYFGRDCRGGWRVKNSVPEECSCAALRQAARHLSKLYDAALSADGISLNQYSILAKLDRFGPNILQDLAAHLVMDRSTLGKLLRPLHARGLVVMEPSAEDRRERMIALSRDGAKLFATAKRRWSKAEGQFSKIFGDSNAAGMRAMMQHITTVEFT